MMTTDAATQENPLLAELEKADPRAVEARAFAEAISALERYNDPKTPEYLEACYVNRKLWLTLQGDLAAEGNQLPDQLKASLLSISIWAVRYLGQMMRGEVPAEPLLMVNRSIMLGLQGQG